MNDIQIPFEVLLPDFYLYQKMSCQYFSPNHTGNWARTYLKKLLENFNSVWSGERPHFKYFSHFN